VGRGATFARRTPFDALGVSRSLLKTRKPNAVGMSALNSELPCSSSVPSATAASLKKQIHAVPMNAFAVAVATWDGT